MFNDVDYRPKIREAFIELAYAPDYEESMRLMESAGRVCHKSEDRVEPGSAEKFIGRITDMGHESVLEHISLSLLFHTDRGVSHELVRHRLCAFSQSSTRYCNYSRERFGGRINVIKPFYFDPYETAKQVRLPNLNPLDESITYCFMNSLDVWMTSMLVANWAYMTLTREFSRTPQEARTVLPNSLATDIYVTANLREWRHILQVRALGNTGQPHPDMQRLMLDALRLLYRKYPVIFQDIYDECLKKGLLEEEGEPQC